MCGRWPRHSGSAARAVSHGTPHVSPPPWMVTPARGPGVGAGARATVAARGARPPGGRGFRGSTVIPVSRHVLGGQGVTPYPRVCSEYGGLLPLGSTTNAPLWQRALPVSPPAPLAAASPQPGRVHGSPGRCHRRQVFAPHKSRRLSLDCSDASAALGPGGAGDSAIMGKKKAKSRSLASRTGRENPPTRVRASPGPRARRRPHRIDARDE